MYKEFKVFVNVLLDEVFYYDEIENFKFFCIYWDVCFFKDKLFYKFYFSGSMVWVIKWWCGGYYFYIFFGGFFVGGGFWDFNMDDLKWIWIEIVNYFEEMCEVF